MRNQSPIMDYELEVSGLYLNSCHYWAYEAGVSHLLQLVYALAGSIPPLLVVILLWTYTFVNMTSKTRERHLPPSRSPRLETAVETT